MWVSAAQANLRDKLVTLYNKAGIVKNGERVEVLEKQKRFARVRTTSGTEGWVELRYLVGNEVYDGFQKLASEAKALPFQGRATTRATLNMHLTPSRDGEVLYQLKDGDKVEILKRAVAEKVQPGAKKPSGTPRVPVNTASGAMLTPAAAATAPHFRLAAAKPEKAADGDAPPAVYEDWWLVRDGSNHAGWVLGRMLDLDVPLDIAQYAEGQRIVACFVLNKVHDEEKDGDKEVPQYLTLMTESHDGLPYDFDQVRVFTWNTKRHRYETGYRERKLFGVLPVKTGTQDFGKEGVLPTFTIHTQEDDGQTSERTYRLIGPIVRRVVAEQPPEKKEPATASATPTARSRPVVAKSRHSRRKHHR